MLQRFSSPVISGVLLILCAWSFGQAIYIYAKAQLAQLLIADSFHFLMETGESKAPWAWADTYPVARLTFEDHDYFVLSGADGTSLAFGPGLLHGTSMPGELGSSIISGHRDTHFGFLEQLQRGSVVTTAALHGHQAWVVEDMMVKDVSRDPGIPLLDDVKELYLVTCYPFDAVAAGGPLRYIVRLSPIEA